MTKLILNAVAANVEVKLEADKSLTALCQFAKIWNATKFEIEFTEEMANNTGYFDHIPSAELVGMEYGDIARCTDNAGRPMLIIKTLAGNGVAFKRYADSFDGVICRNGTPPLSVLMGGSSMSAEALSSVFGNPKFGNLCGNLATTVAFLKEELAKI